MWTNKNSRRAIRTIITYGRPHRRWLTYGGLATIGVVFFRLAMPWPLRGVVELVFPKGSPSDKLLVDYLPTWGDPVLWLGAIYLLFAVGTGIFELLQRTNIMRFAAHTVHDLRAAAVRGATRKSRQRTASGDLIARIIGDSARIKAGLSGILVHVSQNGLLFAGVCALLLYISPQLGLIFLAAGLAAVVIGLRASIPVARTALKQRRKEGHYAVAIQEGLEGGTDLPLDMINASSARKEVRTTKLIALSTLSVHVVLATAVVLALWVGTKQVQAGIIAPGELFLFIAYAMTVHRRMVQVGRQVARSGKVVACVNRISALLDDRVEPSPSIAPAPIPLVSGLRLQGVKLLSDRGPDGTPRLRKTDLIIQPHHRVAVIGRVGAGKSSLIRLLAGRESPEKGKVFWDKQVVSNRQGTLAARVNYLPQEPVFPPTPVWKLLGLAGPDTLGTQQQETLRRMGAWTIIRNLPAGLAEAVGSHHLSPHESRSLSLAGILLGGESSVWILDSPLDGLGRKRARQQLDEIFNRADDRTVVMALSQSIDLDRFDRVLVLRRGQLRFDGPPAQWAERKLAGTKSGS